MSVLFLAAFRVHSLQWEARPVVMRRSVENSSFGFDCLHRVQKTIMRWRDGVKRPRDIRIPLYTNKRASSRAIRGCGCSSRRIELLFQDRQLANLGLSASL